MKDVNVVTLVGRLTKDIELRFSSGGMAIGGLSIAVNGSKKVGDTWEDEAHFFDATILGKRAEGLKPYLNKGQQVAITGQLQQQRWTSQDGSNRSKVVILIDNLQLVGGNKGQSQQSQGDTAQYNEEVPF